MTDPAAAVTWRMARPVQITTYGAAAIAIGLMAFVVGDGRTSDAVGGSIVIAASIAAVLRMRRISLTLGPTSVVAQNMLTSFEIELSEILRVDATTWGVAVVYERDGRRHARTATAGQGMLDPWMFKRARRSRDIAATIAARLPTR